MTHRSKGGRAGLRNPSDAPEARSFWYLQNDKKLYVEELVLPYVIQVVSVETGYLKMGHKSVTVYAQSEIELQLRGSKFVVHVPFEVFKQVYKLLKTKDEVQAAVGLYVLSRY